MNESNYIVDFAEKSDYEKLDEFYKRYSTGGLARFVLKKWREEKGSENHPIFAINNHHHIIGAGCIRICNKKFGHLINWLVHPDWRKKGVASAMDKFAFDVLRNNGIEKSMITISKNNAISLNRLRYLEKNKKARLQKLNKIFFTYAQYENVKSQKISNDIKMATEKDFSEAWWFLRLSPAYYHSRGLYGEDGNFHFLDKSHFKNLVLENRVLIVRNKFWIKGLIIINPESRINDKYEENISEICFYCGNFGPILNSLNSGIWRAYAFTEKNLKKLNEFGFSKINSERPDLNVKINFLFSYERTRLSERYWRENSMSRVIRYWRGRVTTYGDSRPPSVPSRANISHYEDIIKNKKPVRTLILGATPALRDLAALYSQESVVADIAFEAIVGFLRYAKKVDPLKETWARANWLNLPFPDEYFDCIMGDLVLNQLEYGDYGKFLREMERLLSKNGKFAMRCAFRNEKYINEDPEAIIEKTLKEFGSDLKSASHALCWRLQSRFVDSEDKMNIGEIKNSLNKYLEAHSDSAFLKIIIDSDMSAWSQLSEEKLIASLEDCFKIKEANIGNDYADSEVFPIIVLERI